VGRPRVIPAVRAALIDRGSAAVVEVRRAPIALETPALIGAAVALAAATSYALVTRSPAAAAAFALLPFVAIGLVYVVTSGQAILYGASMVLGMLTLNVLGQPIVASIYVEDLVAALALAALIFATFIEPTRIARVPRTPVLGWPFVFFSTAIAAATIRGHYAYGVSLLGQPLRLVFYAAIVAGLIGMTVPKMYRFLVVAFYSAVVWMALVALAKIATNESHSFLSTGGERVLAISTSIYAAGGLFLALLNLRLATTGRARLLHVCIAAIALFDVTAGFGRAVYTAVALAGAVLIVGSSRLRNNVLSVVPLLLPVLLIGVIAVSQATPAFLGSVKERALSSPTTDSNVQWRIHANREVLKQVRENPLFGVGFGRTIEFFLDIKDPTTGIPTTEREESGQDPHNGYLFLWAGGGVLALGSFLLLIGVFVVDSVKRYRRTTDPIGRLIIAWAGATLWVFLVNAASGTGLESPTNILTIWALLVLPSLVREEVPVVSSTGARVAEEPEAVASVTRRIGSVPASA
jgi:O-antigen ligase